MIIPRIQRAFKGLGEEEQLEMGFRGKYMVWRHAPRPPAPAQDAIPDDTKA